MASDTCAEAGSVPDLKRLSTSPVVGIYVTDFPTSIATYAVMKNRSSAILSIDVVPLFRLVQVDSHIASSHVMSLQFLQDPKITNT
jgi:hypothetical protein